MAAGGGAASLPGGLVTRWPVAVYCAGHDRNARVDGRAGHGLLVAGYCEFSALPVRARCRPATAQSVPGQAAISGWQPAPPIRSQTSRSIPGVCLARMGSVTGPEKGPANTGHQLVAPAIDSASSRSSDSVSEVLRTLPPNGCIAAAKRSSVTLEAIMTTAAWPGWSIS